MARTRPHEPTTRPAGRMGGLDRLSRRTFALSARWDEGRAAM